MASSSAAKVAAVLAGLSGVTGSSYGLYSLNSKQLNEEKSDNSKVTQKDQGKESSEGRNESHKTEEVVKPPKTEPEVPVTVDPSEPVQKTELPDFKNISLGYCSRSQFGMELEENRRKQQNFSSSKIDLGSDEFFSDISNANAACFFMQTISSDDGSGINGFSEFAAKTEKYGMIMQSNFQLSTDLSDDSDEDDYLYNWIWFLKRQGDYWELSKSFAWNGKQTQKASEMVDFPKEVIAEWSKDEMGNDLLFKDIGFKTPIVFLRDDLGSGFSHDNLTFQNIDEWYKNVPKGKWNINSRVLEESKQDEIRKALYTVVR